MFDYIMAKPLTEESFSVIKNRLKKIYDHIIKNGKYYDEHDEEKVKNLFICDTCDDYSDWKVKEYIYTPIKKYIYTPDDIDNIGNLFISKKINEEEARKRLNDIICTFSSAVNIFIEDVMESWYFCKKDCYDPELDYKDKNFSELVNSERAITDLINILFGFEGE